MDRVYTLKNSLKAIVGLETVQDVDESMKVIEKVAEEGLYLMEDDVDQKRIDHTKELVKNNGGEILFIVARINGKIVGCLDLVRYGRWHKTDHVRYLDMAVLDGYRSIGVGGALMDFAIEWARTKGIEKILLEVFASNGRAFNLYRKFGFVEEGTNKGVVVIEGKKDDIIQMGLFL